MLVNLWYVAEWSEKVTRDPVKVQMLGQKFVLFRDEAGKAHCLSDVCLHRGGSLSGGWTKGDCVVCPYHGWRFDIEGKVAYIPSEGDDFTAPKRARIDSYPVEERYGMVWVFLGDLPEEERFPIPPCDEYDDPEWRLMSTEFTWKAEAARVVENGIDIAHASFVHPIFGRPETAQENHILEVESGDWWGRSKNLQFPPKFEENWYRKRMRRDQQPTNTHPCWYLPGMVARIRIDINKKMAIVMFDANTPVDEHTTRTFALQFRSFLKHKFFDNGSLKRLKKILAEDATIVENAAPNYLPNNLAHEMSVTDDKFMRTFRAARRKCIEEKGWQIDSAKVEQARGKKVFNIPSPARRTENMKWVIEPVPLVPPKKPENPLKPVETQRSA